MITELKEISKYALIAVALVIFSAILMGLAIVTIVKTFVWLF